MPINTIKPLQPIKPKQLPLTNNGNQTPLQPLDLRQETIQKAQTSALNQQPSPTLDLTTQKTQEILQTPKLDIPVQKQVNLEKFDRERAGAVQALRQKTAGLSTQDEDLTRLLLQGAQDKAVFGADLDRNLAQQQQEQQLKNLAVGQQQAQLESGIESQRIQNLIGAGGAGEAQAEREFKGGESGLDRIQQLLLQSNDMAGNEALTRLQEDFASGRLATQQDFAQAESALDRAQQLAVQSGDIEAQRSIELMRQDFQAKQIQAEQVFKKTENALDRIQQLLLQSNDIAGNEALTRLQEDFASGRLATQQDFAQAESALDRAQQLAVQSGNIEAQRNIELMRQDFQAKQAQADQVFQEKIANMDIEARTSITELKAKLDSEQILRSQDFQSVQAELDRELQQSIFDGDTERQIELLSMKQNFENIMVEKQHEFIQAERLATENWKSEEAFSDREFQQAIQLSNQEFEKAVQENDIIAQEQLLQQRFQLETAQQLQGFSQQEKMFELENMAREAEANNDFNRQRELMTMQNELEFDRIVQAQGFEAGQADLTRRLQESMAEKDFNRSMMLQQQQFAFQGLENEKNRYLQELELDLKNRGVDLQEVQINYERIQDAIANGQASPQSAINFINDTLRQSGTQLLPPDPNATLKAMKEDYNLQTEQFLLTHPEFRNSGYDPNLTARQNQENLPITKTGLEAFNKFYNESIYGENGEKVNNETITNVSNFTSDISRTSIFKRSENILDSGGISGGVLRNSRSTLR